MLVLTFRVLALVNRENGKPCPMILRSTWLLKKHFWPVLLLIISWVKIQNPLRKRLYYSHPPKLCCGRYPDRQHSPENISADIFSHKHNVKMWRVVPDNLF
jgi:hypothetical protein